MNVDQIPLAKPWFGEDEANAAYEVVKSEWLFGGPRVEAFENQFAEMIGSQHAVAVNSGSSALLISLMALDVQAGDEILVPDMTFISTASCALFVGAVPKFVDITNDTYCMDPKDLARKVSDRTKVILPVHYAGQTAEMTSILEIARKRKIRIVEDAAEAHLSQFDGKFAGTIGDLGIFSFTPSKVMTTGEGGMIVTNDSNMAKRLRMIRNFGDKGKFDWVMIGYNFRMMDIQGAIGLVQLKKLSESVRLRRDIAARYTEAFSKVDCVVPPYVRGAKDINFQLYTIRINPECLTIDRNGFIKELGERGVAARLYYPALHRAEVFARFTPGLDADFPTSSAFADTALSLPIFPTMSNENVNQVVTAIEDIAQTFATT